MKGCPMKYICSISLALALAAGPAFAQFYQYTDKNGNVVITDSPPAGAEAREKKVDGGRVHRSTGSETADPALDRKDDPGRAAHGEDRPKKNYNRVNVVMYMTDW
jgi:hypothetical protein